MTDPVMLLSQLHDEGRVTFRALRDAGFYTLTSIAEAPVQTLADRAHLSARTARSLKTGAEELIGKGIGLESPETEAAAAEIDFSEGVLLEEAALLGQGEPADCRPAEPSERLETTEPVAPQEPQSAAGSSVINPIAAAAEAAASLSRAGAVSSARPEPPAAGPSSPRRTFWRFG